MTKAELKAVVAAEVQAQLAELLQPWLQQVAQTIGQVEQLLKSEQQKTNQILQKQLDTVSQVLLKLANVERALGIDPTQEKLDPNYRN